MFATGEQLGFTSGKKFPLNGQTRQAKSPSQPVNLPNAWPLMKPLSSEGPNVII